MSKNPAVVPAPSSPLRLAPWIQELKLSGDLRLCYQWDEEQVQEPSAAPGIRLQLRALRELFHESIE